MKKHKHKYHFAKKVEMTVMGSRAHYQDTYYEFICLCGKVKRVKELMK